MGNQITSSFKAKQPHPKHNSALSKGNSSIPTNKLHKIKPFLSSSRTWRCTNPADFTYISKLRPKLLPYINFVNHSAKNTGTKALRTLARTLADTKRSVNLSIRASELNYRQLRYLINSTNHLKKIEILALPSNKVSDHQLLESLLRIGRNKDLCELTASSAQFLLQNPKTLPPIIKQIRQLRKMEHLSVNSHLTWNELIRSRNSLRSFRSFHLKFIKDFPLYFSKLSQCNRLEHLRLAFADTHQIRSQEIQHWNSFFLKKHALKNLSLCKNFRSNEDLENFKLFPECFKFMNQLTTLSLQLNRVFRQITEQNENNFFLSFFTHLKYLTQLQKLEFTIVGDFLLKNIHIEHLALFLQDLKNLQTLQLNLPHLESPSEVFISLAKGLQHLSDLKHLKISCKNNKTGSISYKALEIFSCGIAHLQLESLGFPLFQTEESLAPFFRALSGFQDLSNLNLDLSTFPPQGFKDCALALKSLHKLSSVSLIISQLDPANNFQDLSNFLSCFKVMPYLSLLNLKFSGKNLCDQEFDVIATNLNYCCRHLSRLELIFEHADQLSENCFDYLQAGFANLLNLEYLKLEIWREFGRENVNFDAVWEFLAGLTFLKRLKELSFKCHDLKYSLSTHCPMPASLHGLYILKHLTKIVVNGCQYI